MADPDGRRRFELLLGGGQGPVDDRAEKLRRFKKNLRYELLSYLDFSDPGDRSLAADLSQMTAAALCGLVVERRDQSATEMRRLMQPGFGR